MKNVAPLLGAFLLGVLCTVGVYEVVRFITNTRDAIQAASALAEDDSPAEASVSAEPTSKNPKNRVDVDDQRERLEQQARKPNPGKARKYTAEQRKERRRRRWERKQRRKERWEAMTEEEREERRQARLMKRGSRVVVPLAGGRGNVAPGRFGGLRGGDAPGLDGAGDGPEDEMAEDDGPRDTNAR